MNYRPTLWTRRRHIRRLESVSLRCTRAFTPLRYGCGLLTWLAVGYVGWHGAEVQRRAALGILQCVPDVPDDGGRLKADLARRQAEHHDLVFAHPPATGEGLRVVLRGQVPFARVDLDGDAQVRPPRVGAGDERPVLVVDRR